MSPATTNTNTSATGGYLALSAAGDVGAWSVWHDLIVGITGLPGDLVRPRWHYEPMRTPPEDVTWIAAGLMRIAPIGAPQIRHVADPSGGRDMIIAGEELTLLVSAIGPDCLALAATVADGIHVAQNRHSLRPAGVAFARAEPITVTPTQVNEHWRDRADLPLIFRRERRRTVAVRSLLCCGSAGSAIESQSGATVPLYRCEEGV